MIPASFAKSLPVGQNLDPFEIYFILDKTEYKKNRGWINRLNKDTSLTSGLFKIKAFPRELLFSTKEGEYVADLLEYSNVIARALHPDEKIVHVEHQHIDVSEGNTEIFRKSLELFILQLLRANLDEVRQFMFFGTGYAERAFDIFDDMSSLKNIENIFEELVDYYASKINRQEKLRLRPFKSQPHKRAGRKGHHESRLEQNFLSFQWDSEFSNYSPLEAKIKDLEALEIKKDDEGNFSIKAEDLISILLKAGLIVKTPKGGVNPWIEPDKIIVNIIEGSGRTQSKRYPILEVVMGSLVHHIQLKSKEGTILYLATLLKRSKGNKLRREEIIHVFKNIPQNLADEINRDNLCEYVADENLAAYYWIKEIYTSIFGKDSFNQWCYQMYITDCDRAFRTGLYQLKEHISISMYNAGYEAYTPFIKIESDKNSTKSDYSIKAFPHNIHLCGSLEILDPATSSYLSQEIKE